MSAQMRLAATAMADAISAASVAGDLNQAIEVQRIRDARYDLDEMAKDKKARVTIVQVGKEIQRKPDGSRVGTRSRVGGLFAFDIAVHRYVETVEQEDSVEELAEQIEALFTNKRLVAYQELSWFDNQYKAIFSAKALAEKKVFLAVTQIRFAGSL